MPLRQIDIYVPADCEIKRFLTEKRGIIDLRTSAVDDEEKVVRVLAEVEESEALIDRISERYSTETNFRMVVHEIAASLPHPPDVDPEKRSEKIMGRGPRVLRINRVELYQRAADSVELTVVYLLLAVLSAIVAAGGLLANRVELIIGAMMIAPVFEPNLALSLATTLGDWKLARQALIVNSAGLLCILFVGVIIGLFTPVDLSLSSIVSRTDVLLSDLALALAAGTAGALSYARGVAGALIGVVVAVALVPPLVVFGLLLGNGAYPEAANACLLTLTNLTAINLAGVATFLAKGILPRPTFEEKRARESAWRILFIWLMFIVLLGLLAVLV